MHNGQTNAVANANLVVAGLVVAGWREWVALPDLGVPWVKAKLDTGARSSSIHAYGVEEFERDGIAYVRFAVQPWQRSREDATVAELPVLDRRLVKSSTGHTEERPVVSTTLRVVGLDLHAELTLSNRDSMGFRMLIGRQALRGKLLVHSGRSYAGGKPSREIRRLNRGKTG